MSKKTGLALSERSESNGFTLIEIMVVVFIIGLLASIITVSVNNARMRGRDSRRQADLDTIRTGIELFANQNNGDYPGLPNTLYTSAGWGAFGTDLTGGASPIMPTVPADPVAGRVYRFRTNAAGTQYEIDALLDVNQPADGGSCATRFELGNNLNIFSACL